MIFSRRRERELLFLLLTPITLEGRSLLNGFRRLNFKRTHEDLGSNTIICNVIDTLNTLYARNLFFRNTFLHSVRKVADS
jgi:hypothetical protein